MTTILAMDLISVALSRERSRPLRRGGAGVAGILVALALGFSAIPIAGETRETLDAGAALGGARGSHGTQLLSGSENRIPKIWRTGALYALGALTLILIYHRTQSRRLKLEAESRRMLEREVELRTLELEERNHELEAVNRLLEQASLTDSLTGLKNRRYVLTQIPQDLAQLERRRRQIESGTLPKWAASSLLCLMFDLDGFKEINDTLGHAAGDEVLVQVRKILEEVCRKSDTVARWGGDEFMVIGRNADRDNAEILAERLRSAIELHEFQVGDRRPARLTCSIGMALYPFLHDQTELLTFEQVVSVADRALYVAKHNGRNAWVGIFSRETEGPADLFRRIHDEDDPQALESWIEIRTSIHLTEDLVWKSS